MKKIAIVLGALLAALLIAPSVMAQGQDSSTVKTVTIPRGEEGLAKIDTSLATSEVKLYTDNEGRKNAHVAPDIRVETKSGIVINRGAANPVTKIVMDAQGKEQVVASWANGPITTYSVSSRSGGVTSTAPTTDTSVERIVLAIPAGVEGLAKTDSTLAAGTVKQYTDNQNRLNAHTSPDVRIVTEDGKVINAGASGTNKVVVMDADGAETVAVAWTTDTLKAWSVTSANAASTTTSTTAAPSTTTTTAPSTTTATAPTTTTTTTAPTTTSGSQDPSGTAKFPAPHATIYAGKDSGRFGFISTCTYVNTQTVDPIVFPGDKTRSHAHDFFGNRSTDENTTSDSLIRNTSTSCQHADDLSAYWTPSAYDGGKQAPAVGTSMYYFTDKVNDPSKMKAMPVGLRMIAGSANATGPQSSQVTWFEEHRNATNNTRGSNNMITANQSGQVTVRVNFPQCWNGTQLDSPDHKSHMAYINNGVCPSSHPVMLPQLTTFVRYDANGGSDFALSSGPWYTAHADFWNAWHPDTFAEILDHCRTERCQRVSSK